LFNIIGALATGVGLGLYKRLSDRTFDRSGYSKVITFTLYSCMTILLIAPLFEYRAMASQLKAGKTSTSIWLKLVYFIVNGVLSSIGLVSILNVVQHSDIKLAEVGMVLASIPTAACLLLDTLVLKTTIPTFSLLAAILSIVVPTGFNIIARRKN